MGPPLSGVPDAAAGSGDGFDALIPAALAVAWVVLRTALEDAPLRRELHGHAEYAGRVRSPGGW